MKIECKSLTVSYLHFSRGHEKAVKISDTVIFNEKGGTSTKTRPKCPFFNNFPVPPNAWDKRGTTVGHGTSGTRKVFSKIVKKTMKNGCKWLNFR